MSKYSKRKRYNKLIRDNIPEYLDKKGVPHETHVADDAEYTQKLKEKIIEEAKEIFQAETKEEVCAELADLQEVVDALCELHGIDPRQISEKQEEKRLERGAFKKRIILDWS